MLDSHLSQYQKVHDAIAGHGQIPAVLDVNGNRLAANYERSPEGMGFRIVGKATAPAAEAASRSDFEAGKVDEFHCTFNFGYRRNHFNTAVLRASYLVLFKCFGYEYARHDVVQQLRRRICDPMLAFPNLQSLVLGLRGFEPPFDRQHYLVQGDVDGVHFFLVILRVRRATTSYLGTYLPVPVAGCETFFEKMDQVAAANECVNVTIPHQALYH